MFKHENQASYPYFSEPISQLPRCEAILIKSIIPSNSLQNFEVSTHQPITTLVDHLEISNVYCQL